ncbi:hypothetical protein ACHAQA_008946 [Verticillium albo-atrum]
MSSESPSLGMTLLRVSPLVFGTAMFAFSVGHGFASGAFLSPQIPKQARHAVWAYWLRDYGRIVVVNSPSILSTLATCLINMYYSHISRAWWLAAVVLILGHMFPFSVGLRWMTLKPEDFKAMSEAEGVRWIKEVPGVNRRRALFPDMFAWLTVVYAVTANLQAASTQ